MSMVNISDPMYAKYSASGTTVSYSNGGSAGYARSVDVSLDDSEDNELYGDGVIVAVDRKFAGGTITVGTTEMDDATVAAMLGVTQSAITGITAITDTNPKELIYDDNIDTPYVGYGFVIEGNVDDAEDPTGDPYYRAVVFAKIMFSLPDSSLATREKDIDWQTPELSGKILRDDSADHVWKREATFTTKAQALAYLKNRLNIT